MLIRCRPQKGGGRTHASVQSAWGGEKKKLKRLFGVGRKRGGCVNVCMHCGGFWGFFAGGGGAHTHQFSRSFVGHGGGMAEGSWINIEKTHKNKYIYIYI